MTTTATDSQASSSLRPEQATGLAYIEEICTHPSVSAAHAERVLRLAQRFPGILQLMESIIRRHHKGKTSPGRDRVRIRVEKADQALMAQTGALCNGVYASVEDQKNHPGMRGWRCEIFYACDATNRLCGDSVGSELPQQRSTVRPVAMLVAQMGEYMTSIIGLTITGWWNPEVQSKDNPATLEFCFTVYKKPAQGFPKLVSNWSDDSFRLHFNARETDGLQEQVRRGTGELCPNIRSAVQALMPLVTDFETRTLSGFAEWLELGRSGRQSTSSTGSIGDINFRYSFVPVLPDHSEVLDGSHPGAWMSQAMNQPPTHWNVTLEFWRDTPNGKCKIGFFYSFICRDSSWINNVARELRFDTIDATVNGAEKLLGDLNRRWAERKPTAFRTRRATPMRHYNDKGGFCAFWASRENLVAGIEVTGDLLKTLTFLLAECEEGDWVLLVEEHYYNTPDFGEGCRLMGGRLPKGCETAFDLSVALRRGTVTGVQLPL